ncbi:MAG: ribosome assembly RNA-binding protein YhbY [Myxococcota bacterium]|nr:ribosome assembly RNA-binding protein YhbY [Myxococcota bacterium]
MTALSAKQKKYLKGLGHSLKSIVQVGYKGLTEAVVSQIDQALNDHELIKIKVGNNSEQGPKEMTSALVESLSCHVVQTIGGVILVYREAEEPEDRVIKLPKA